MRSPLKIFLVLLLVLLLAAGGWAAWTYWGTNIVADGKRDEALASLEQAWKDVPQAEKEAELPLPEEGEPVWILEIPAIDLREPIVAGVSDEALNTGVAWYPTTALPGEVGNMGLAGRRITNGEPFRRLLELDEGDEIIVESAIKRYTYAVRVAPRDLTVQEGDSWVLEAVPGDDFDPHESILTLTTDQDFYPTPDRSVAFAALTGDETK